MTPGLAGPPFPSRAIKGVIVAVASLEKPSVPMFVGVCEIDIASLQKVQGLKGHAVRGQHWAGDEIWAWSPIGKSGGDAPEFIEGWDANEASVDAGMQSLSIDSEEDESSGGVAVNVPENRGGGEARNEHVEGEDPEPSERVGVEEKALSTKGE